MEQALQNTLDIIEKRKRLLSLAKNEVQEEFIKQFFSHHEDCGGDKDCECGVVSLLENHYPTLGSRLENATYITRDL